MATKPELLLLDELMAGLNPTEVAQATELVTRIRYKGITIFMIEHVMGATMSVCDRIIVLHHGEKIAEGTPQEIATSETAIKVYLVLVEKRPDRLHFSTWKWRLMSAVST